VSKNNFGIILFFLVMLTALIPIVAAETNQSYVVIQEPSYGPPNAVYRIEQGQDVYINDTVDITGQGWGDGIAWYGKYGESSDPKYILKFTDFRRDLYRFYINPDIFLQRTGMWYQYYGNATEVRGNLAMFNVKSFARNITTTYPNGTMMEKSVFVSNGTSSLKVEKEVILPDIYVSDFVVCRGDSLNTTASKAWVFGRVDGAYDTDGLLSAKDIWDLEVGSYKVVLHDPGRNGIYEVGYDASSQLLTSPWRSVKQVSVADASPMVAMDRFKSMIKGTDDGIETLNLEVQEPTLTIARIDHVAAGNRIPEAYEPGVSLLDVRGYTNAENNTVISFKVDPDTSKYKIWTARAQQSNPGNMRFYQVYIPINLNEMPNGIHTIKAWNPQGAFVFADFPVSELPADSFVPNATMKYVGDRNPWVAPIIQNVTVEVTKVVIKTVVVEVTPKPEVVFEQQLEARRKVDAEFWMGSSIYLNLGVFC
jgi:hypothetical protein